MNDNFDDEPLEVVMPAKRSKLRALIAKMGLGAFTISLMVHVVFAIIAIFFMYKWVYPPVEKLDFIPPGGGGGGKGGETKQAVKTKQAKKMMSNTALNKRITSTSLTTSFALPDAEDQTIDTGVPVEIASTEMGAGDGSGGGKGAGKGIGIGANFGPGSGMGTGEAGIGALIPTLMKGRCTEAERMRMIAEAGGTAEVEAAVKKSLQWLKGRQNADGSWGESYPVGMTGLVLLCYLGHCESTQSAEYGDNVTRAITFLVDVSMKNQGRMATSYSGIPYAYEHAMATYALSEALTFSRSLKFTTPGLEKAVEDAVTIILKGQTAAGGWDYVYVVGNRNDLSVMGWQLQALKAAKAAKVRVADIEAAAAKAIGYIGGIGHVGDGKFIYADGPSPAMTPVGALCLQQWEKGSSKPLREAVQVIRTGLMQRGKKSSSSEPTDYAPLYRMEYNSPNSDLYAWYYAAQVMRNAGGKNWELMNGAIIADILPAQNADGSFKPEPGGGPLAHGAGTREALKSQDIYVQALDTLMLEVYYRFLPTSAGSGSGSSATGLE